MAYHKEHENSTQVDPSCTGVVVARRVSSTLIQQKNQFGTLKQLFNICKMMLNDSNLSDTLHITKSRF